jgi:hypothetical protein
MTVTKREIMKALAHADDDAVIYIDNGIDCIECRAVEWVENAQLPQYDHVSTKENVECVEDGSIVLRLS